MPGETGARERKCGEGLVVAGCYGLPTRGILVDPEGLANASPSNGLAGRTPQNPPVDAKSNSAGVANRFDRFGAALADAVRTWRRDHDGHPVASDPWAMVADLIPYRLGEFEAAFLAGALLRAIDDWQAEEVLREAANEMGFELTIPGYGTGVEGYA